MHWLKKINLWPYLPAIVLSDKRPFQKFMDLLPSGPVVLDAGSGGRLLSPDIITLDKFITGNIKVIGDLHELPFKNESIDGIICTAVLEHVENPWIVANEFHRVLKVGGKVYIGTPFMQGYHPSPTDYWRFTEDGLIKLFEQFKQLHSGYEPGAASGLSWALMDFFRAFSDSKYVSESLGIIVRIFFFWVKYFDLLLRGKKNNRYFASGAFFIGEKQSRGQNET